VTPIPSAISIDAFSFNNISTILKCPFVDASIKAVFPFCPLIFGSLPWNDVRFN
jgi:hypothetical protein